MDDARKLTLVSEHRWTLSRTAGHLDYNVMMRNDAFEDETRHRQFLLQTKMFIRHFEP
ncbi:MAG: hypothetical protein KDA84_00990 [Planctomycetaceae bacterium]|nr:hypothetical protein [Planctomycetaceae bacterium]